ncbi:MAG: hypothetical protein WAM91_09180 [Candidatus Acidiferrales bacterium]
MRKINLTLILMLAAIAILEGRAHAQGQPNQGAPAQAQKEPKECSTEKVNGNCKVTIDRNYPLTLPTIQVRPKSKVSVFVIQPLPFETLTLDPQSAQALAGTDQTAGFLTAALPDIKGFIAITSSTSSAHNLIANVTTTNLVRDPNLGKVDADLQKLKNSLVSAETRIETFGRNATFVYLQLQEILSPIPRPMSGVSTPGTVKRLSDELQNTPNPWDEYAQWKIWLLRELVGAECPNVPCPTFDNLLAAASTVSTNLTAKPNVGPPPVYPILKDFDSDVTTTRTDIASLSASDQAASNTLLDGIISRKNALVASFPVYTAAISSIVKDLNNYSYNITLTDATIPRNGQKPLGIIFDPGDSSPSNTSASKLLGRQVVFAVNAVNEVGTSAASVPGAQQKKSIATVTVLYASPIFEVSTGAFFSTLPNRSFSNVTTVTQSPGLPPTPGNVVITQMIGRPTIVPFVAGNFRLGHEFAWPDRRRGAFYFTSAIGLNPYNTTAEFGFGPSISWRSIMFSGLFHLGHDVRLTQGETVGQIWCNQSGPVGVIPKCSGSPPSPSTEKYWTGAFAFGISVRVPSVFGGGGGGSSGSSGGSGGGGH